MGEKLDSRGRLLAADWLEARALRVAQESEATPRPLPLDDLARLQVHRSIVTQEVLSQAARDLREGKAP